MNQPPQWGPQQGQWSGQGYPQRPRKGVPVIVWILLVVLGVPFIMCAGCVVCAAASKPRAPSSTATVAVADGAASNAECDRYLAEFHHLPSEDLPYDEGIRKLNSWLTDAENGQRACVAAGRKDDAKSLEAGAGEVRRQKEKAISAHDADPANCPKGQTLVDAKTGKKIPCTGSVAKPQLAAGSDDDDIHTRCQKFNDFPGMTVIRCNPYFPDHHGIAVTVASSAWESLGENGQHQAFTKSVLESYKAHWTKFHGWKGEDAPDHQVQIYAGSGTEENLAATMSATGFYTGD